MLSLISICIFYIFIFLIILLACNLYNDLKKTHKKYDDLLATTICHEKKIKELEKIIKTINKFILQTEEPL